MKECYSGQKVSRRRTCFHYRNGRLSGKPHRPLFVGQVLRLWPFWGNYGIIPGISDPPAYIPEESSASDDEGTRPRDSVGSVPILGFTWYSIGELILGTLLGESGNMAPFSVFSVPQGNPRWKRYLENDPAR